MIFSLPVLAIFSTALVISHGERNCPFFRFTARPVFPAATSRSVCRARNAGICKTSHTFAAAATCPTSWTSAKTGSLNCCLIFARMRSPSLSPGPRNDFSEERLALSYEALKIYGTPWSPAMRWMLSAIFMACASFSITHGPAIRKRGWAPPMRTFPTAISRVFIFSPPRASVSPCVSSRAKAEYPATPGSSTSLAPFSNRGRSRCPGSFGTLPLARPASQRVIPGVNVAARRVFSPSKALKTSEGETDDLLHFEKNDADSYPDSLFRGNLLRCRAAPLRTCFRAPEHPSDGCHHSCRRPRWESCSILDAGLVSGWIFHPESCRQRAGVSRHGSRRPFAALAQDRQSHLAD